MDPKNGIFGPGNILEVVSLCDCVGRMDHTLDCEQEEKARTHSVCCWLWGR
jgi:hypothetical protein